jgi:hypothetical protein
MINFRLDHLFGYRVGAFHHFWRERGDCWRVSNFIRSGFSFFFGDDRISFHLFYSCCTYNLIAWATIVVRVCRASPPTLLYSHSFRLSMFHCSVIVRCVSAVYRAIVGNLRDWQKGRYTHKRAHNWLFSFTLLTFLLLLFQSFFSSSPPSPFNWPALISLFCWHGKNVYKIRRGGPTGGAAIQTSKLFF